MTTDDEIRDRLAERLIPFVWSTGDVDAVLAEILPRVRALIAEGRQEVLDYFRADGARLIAKRGRLQATGRYLLDLADDLAGEESA